MEVEAALHNFCEKKIRKKSTLIDFKPRYLKKAFRQFGKKKLLTLRAPEELYGKNLSKEEYFSAIELLQSYSGAFGFFQRQHQAAARLIVEGDNSKLKREKLPPMARGKEAIGVSVSHLRFPQQPKVTGKRMTEGFSLSGNVKWVSGYRLFDQLVLGFILPDEEKEAMALIPFRKSRFLKISKPYKTVALSSIQTVALQIKDLIVDEDQVLALKPLSSYRQRSSSLSVHFVNLSAIARAAIRELDKLEKDEQIFQSLCNEYEKYRNEFLKRDSDAFVPDLYATMHKIASDLVFLARFSYGTLGILIPNTIERLSRELFLFSVLTLDENIGQLCLKKMIRNPKENNLE